VIRQGSEREHAPTIQARQDNGKLENPFSNRSTNLPILTGPHTSSSPLRIIHRHTSETARHNTTQLTQFFSQKSNPEYRKTQFKVSFHTNTFFPLPTFETLNSDSHGRPFTNTRLFNCAYHRRSEYLYLFPSRIRISNAPHRFESQERYIYLP